jgi:hypothetical protein
MGSRTPEGQFKADLRAYLESIGAFWSNITGGPYSKIGDPDIVICYHGHYVGIEAKTYTGRQSPLQKVREQQIIAAGGRYILARTLDDVRHVLEELDMEDWKCSEERRKKQ